MLIVSAQMLGYSCMANLIVYSIGKQEEKISNNTLLHFDYFKS